MVSAMERLSSVEDLDAEKGTAMCGGDEALYRTVLAQYSQDAEKYLPILGETLKNIAAAKKEGGRSAGAPPPWLQSFVIHIHALKSASASVGADALSHEAMLLEKAGAEGDMGLIEARLEPFTQRFSKLAARIGEILPEAGGGTPPDFKTP
jgi:HPt (histidine-containing phosphotransfer) domain-containing protein